MWNGRGRILGHTLDHVRLIAMAVPLATIVGLPAGIIAYRVPAVRSPVINFCSAVLTVPSLALFSLMIPVMIALPGVRGIGTPPTIAALVLYSLLPIVRNTVVGLEGVDPAIKESAQGMGQNAWQRLRSVELPLAWPVALTGLRVATQLTVGIAAIAALVGGPGLGREIFRGIRTVPSPGGVEHILAGTLMIAILAVVFDLVYQLISRLTTSKGIR